MDQKIKSVIFRVDASIDIGTGHVMRCLTLADMLHATSVKCKFICRAHKGNLIDLIVGKGYEVISLSNEGSTQASADFPKHAYWLGVDWKTDALQTRKVLEIQEVDWLIVDHYALNSDWEGTLRPFCERLMVIDDLADRPHDCDLILDQNLGRVAKDYGPLVGSEAQILIGPSFALLRPDFAEFRPRSLARREHAGLKNLLITMGGVDKDNVAGKILEELRYCQLPEDLKITVVMGSKAPWVNEVREQAKLINCPTQVKVDVKDMAKLMMESDLAIGAAGSTSWERCCLGLPSIQLILADNQRQVGKVLADLQAAISLDNVSDLKKIIRSVNEGKLKKLTKNASLICDGQGTSRVVSNILA